MPSDTVRGRLDALILAVIEDEPLHGYAVIEALRRRSSGAFDLPTGTVYPALRRLERAGYVHSEWTTVGGRRRSTPSIALAKSRHADRSEVSARLPPPVR